MLNAQFPKAFFLQGRLSEKHEMKMSFVALWELISHLEYIV